MKSRRRIGFVILGFFFASSVAFSAGEVSISQVVTFAKQDSPIRITGIQLPDKSESYPRSPAVILHNTTAKIATKVWLGDFALDPRATNERFHYSPRLWEQWDSESPVLPLGDEVISLERHGLSPIHVAAMAQARVWDSNCLQVTLFVRKVEFADGTLWQQDPSGNQTLWQNSILPQSLKACDSSPETQDALEKLLAETARPDPVGLSGSQIVQSYMVACPMVDVGGGLTAICDW